MFRLTVTLKKIRYMKIHSSVKSHRLTKVRSIKVDIFIDEIFLYLERESTHIETSVFFFFVNFFNQETSY